jgi:Holliday junction resolvase
MVNAKKKGNRGENVFAEFLRSNGFKAYKDSASGASTHKSDIVNGLDYSMEIKTVKKIGLKEAWKQVTRDSSLARNAPLLAVHFDGMPDKEWLVCLHSNDWIELEKLARQGTKSEAQPTNLIQGQRELAYALNSLKVALSKVNRLLE